MKYTCANCDHPFESNHTAPRCPKCLRKHGLIAEPAGGPAQAGSGKAKVTLGPRRRALVLAGLAVLHHLMRSMRLSTMWSLGR